MNVEQHQVAADPQTKPPDLGCESACRLLSSTTTIANIQPESWYSFTAPRRVEGWVDLGTAGRAQPVPEAVNKVRVEPAVVDLSPCAPGRYLSCRWACFQTCPSTTPDFPCYDTWQTQPAHSRSHSAVTQQQHKSEARLVSSRLRYLH